MKVFEHSTINHAENSCDSNCLRVKSKLWFGCSIRWTNKRRSITELNSDSHRSLVIVKHSRRLSSRTFRSGGGASSAKFSRSSAQAQRLSFAEYTGHMLARSARTARVTDFPSFFRIEPPVACARRVCPQTPVRLRCFTEFISVSGFCADRSALCSDLRLKRISGLAAATVLPCAPMNSPDASNRVSF